MVEALKLNVEGHLQGEGAPPGCEADSMKGSGDWFSSCFAVPSLFLTKARTCAQASVRCDQASVPNP